MCVTDKLPIVDFQLTIGGTYGAYTDGASRTNESICIAGLAGVSFAAGVRAKAVFLDSNYSALPHR